MKMLQLQLRRLKDMGVQQLFHSTSKPIIQLAGLISDQ